MPEALPIFKFCFRRKQNQSLLNDRKKKLFQFLSTIGAKALRFHLGRVQEMAESSPDRYTYERKIAERFGGQQELELIVPAKEPPHADSPGPWFEQIKTNEAAD